MMLRELAKNQLYRFGLVLLPGCSMISVASLLSGLNSANRISGQCLYEWQLLSVDGAVVVSSDGLPVTVDSSIAEADELNAIIVCGGNSNDIAAFPGLKNWISRRLTCTVDGAKVELGALDSGSLLLAEMGFLDGYACSVHWDLMAVLKERFPKVEVTNRLYVFDQNRFTCAGATATLDMLLYLICYHRGGELCAAISEQLNCDRIRDQHDKQRLPMQNFLGVGQPQLVEAISLMEANLEEPISTAELALLVGVSRRHLERQFQKSLKTTPVRYYLQLRLQKAQQLLSQTNLPLLDIGIACGFSGKAYFIKCYREYFGVTPGEGRKQARLLSGENQNPVSSGLRH